MRKGCLKSCFFTIWMVAVVILFSACMHQESDFERRFPRPGWWHTVFSFTEVNSYEELQSCWKKNANTNPKRFFKVAYTAIVQHPDNADIMMTSINLFPYCDPSYPHLVPLMEYALENHFGYVDHRCGASPADTVAGIVTELAKQYVRKGEYDKGVAVMERLLAKRKSEINDQLLELMSNVYAQALFSRGDRAEAIQLLERAITDYNGDWETDLRDQLAMYRERMGRNADAGSGTPQY